ncbi:RdgB/HAM1 family non-canonical purine NTP pyrophosphatase [Candidatus Amarolinea dominans]|uniref:RdgB/HAM1 family non-canonical purine NTP pyrophosphatase n=1 Tax=Candidatus Amarolinea dominans TaxID=3140696 RepID=UPI001DDD982E|nr:RdgB/HAM1 family non-canonical purine NTP pyrophosphatase [Anaerolineae bacterium]MBK9095703.1 RdgB/HAM1 family non-canonical purine NTP pyrophosphatase [Anaerolineae bacterium]MBK9233328.1 RdgB/HAM1 family non-canonical purine NTP pyrophosphatase [Anaerolineae bacterium]
MRKLLIATHNQGKVREYRELLADLPVDVTYLDEVGITTEVAETGESFAENAVLKALGYAEMTGLWTWADDSGLEVDVLGGEPGIYSARYGGLQGEQERYNYLLARLADVPDAQRAARFRCVVALAFPDGDAFTASGAIEGTIAHAPRGSNGFGYDPIFEIEHSNLTLAEISSELKNAISHRAKAARSARRILLTLLAELGEDDEAQDRDA